MQSPPRSSSPRRPESKQRSPNDSRTDRTINQTPVKPLKTRVNRDSLVDDGIDSSEPHVGQEISSPVRSPRNIPEKTTICRRPDLPGKQERIDHHKSPFVKRGQTDDGLPKQSPTKRDEAVTDDSLKSTPRDVSESSLLSSKSSELLEELHSSSSTPPPLTSDGVNQPLVTPIVQKRDDIVAMSSMIMASPATKPRERERKTPARIDTFGDSFSLTSTFGTTSQQSQSIKVPRTAGPLSPKKTEQE
ncbi:hypothetical protein BLNAU_6742 [Blattamonas nauphoetae]|uniref:Uncharacterized protein n=1 Tax=Blattamonas nauphoetae TaxID=2049346 RepID=A0ABQ9Y3D0_9EUKA|nr:hypothetical protein BLNAU_6742 [Blattamonas nauphoetae]